MRSGCPGHRRRGCRCSGRRGNGRRPVLESTGRLDSANFTPGTLTVQVRSGPGFAGSGLSIWALAAVCVRLSVISRSVLTNRVRVQSGSRKSMMLTIKLAELGQFFGGINRRRWEDRLHHLISFAAPLLADRLGRVVGHRQGEIQVDLAIAVGNGRRLDLDRGKGEVAADPARRDHDMSGRINLSVGEGIGEQIYCRSRWA